MATRAFLGVSNDWNNTANWTGATVPVSGDDIVFDGRGGSQDVTLNVDQNLVAPASLSVNRSYLGSIGASGSPLIIKPTTLRYAGSGAEFWFDSGAGTVTTTIIGTSSTGDNAAQLDGQYTDVVVSSGRVQFNTNATITGKFRVTSVPGGGNAPNVTLPSGLTVSGAELIIAAGNIDTDAAWPDVLIQGGFLTHDTSTIAMVRAAGGRYIAKNGTVTTYEAFGSHYFDGSQSGGWAVTTMNATGPNCAIDLQNGIGLEPATLNQFANPKILGRG